MIKILKKIKKVKKYFSFWYILLALSVLFISYLIIDTRRHPTTISIAVGQQTGAYYEHAQQYKKILQEKYDVELEIIQSIGSQHAQEKVLNNKVDFAIAQSSTEIEERKNELFALANISYEPIWIFYKENNISTFHDLKYRKNNIDKEKSGTNIVAKLLLKQINISSKSKEHNSSEALKLLNKGQLDSVFLTIGIKSKMLDKFFQIPQIKILDFKEAPAYKSFFLKKSEFDNYAFSKTHYFQIIELKKHSLDILKKLPSQDISLLTTQTLLVTKNSSDEMVRLLLKVAKEVHDKASILNEEHHFPNHSMFKLKQHPASVDYFKEKEHRYERYNLFNSFWFAQSLKKLEDFILLFIIPIGLIAFFVEVIYPASKMLTRLEINKWYKTINQSDTNIEELSLDELKKRKEILKSTLIEIQNRDDLDPIHLEAYYSVQNQITNILETFDKRIKKKEEQRIYLEVE